jgi:hypothetical protein
MDRIGKKVNDEKKIRMKVQKTDEKPVTEKK